MAQKFYKGRTNNHLTWVMVDATDFATPESALSAATKIKVYGKLRGATGTNVVSSGTGSLTNDITHVGASALGIYTIALAKADLSDASAAWYDQYIISLSATGAAYQMLVIDGGIDDSALSDLISNAYSAAAQASSRVLVVQSMASDAASAAQQANSRVILVLSQVSDTYSQLSDFRSDLNSQLAVGVQLNASSLSDIRSAITAGATGLDASALSDIASAVVAAIGAAGVELGASSMSDIRSAILLGQSMASDAASAAQQANSRALVMLSQVSDIYSLLSDHHSDFQSRVPKRVATDSQLSDLHSDLKSYLGVMSGIESDIYSNLAAGVTVGASSLSDLASAVWATVRAEPTAVVSPTGTMKTGVEWLVALSRNKVTQTATVQSLRNDADSADIASAAVSDDGTTFTRGEFA